MGFYLVGWLAILLMVAFRLVLSEVSSMAEIPMRHSDCPLLDDSQHPVQLPNPSNCSKYFSCLQGIAYSMSCPDNLHWSSLTYRCDYPDVAKCTNGQSDLPILDTFTTTQDQSASLSSAKKTLFQAYQLDCNGYYRCELLRCPSGLHWNAQLQRCDFPHMAQCAQFPAEFSTPVDIPITTTTSAVESSSIPHLVPSAATPPPTAATPLSNLYANDLDAICANAKETYVVLPGDCHRFIQCNGIAFVHTCPGNLFWNSELSTCDRYCK